MLRDEVMRAQGRSVYHVKSGASCIQKRAKNTARGATCAN
jgi:hypothetical protein